MERERAASRRRRPAQAKGPIRSQEDLDALISSARALSREHWEVVTILYKTGIEVEALRKLTWRDLDQRDLVWRRPQRRERVIIQLDDPDLAAAVSGYVRRPRRSSDQLDRLVRQARDEAGRPGLASVTPMSLRLTRCLSMLEEGVSVEAVARTLNLKPAVVRGVADHPGPDRRAQSKSAGGNSDSGDEESG